MTSYELAKKLKDAGFPQRNVGLCKHEIWGANMRRESCDCIEGDTATVPSLSELIEACGDNLINLTKEDTGWSTNATEEYAGDTQGNTPEEAVANLWLALNTTHA